MNEKVSAVRRRYSCEEREEIIAEYEGSGLTQAAFVRKRGISLASLSNWLRVHRQKGRKLVEKEIGFESVDMSGMFGGRVWVAEVAMPNGMTVRFGEEVDLKLAQRLVKVLRQSC